MLKFKLINYIDEFYHYEIYPEGKEEDKGWIIFNPVTKELKEKKEPKSNFPSLISKFLQNVKDNDGNYKESGTVAWY